MLVDIKLTCEVTFADLPQGSTFMFIIGDKSPAESVFIKGMVKGGTYCDYGTNLSDGVIAEFSAGAKVTPINLKVTNV